MKKLLAILTISATMVACNNDSEKTTDPAATVDAAKATADSAIAKMKADSAEAANKMGNMTTDTNKLKEAAAGMKENADKMMKAVTDTAKKNK